MLAADVVVFGAGVAGLAAAQYLHEHAPPGLSVVVLEARGRVGGRCWSAAAPNPDDASHRHTLDLGAAWVHGTSRKNPIVPFLDPGQLRSVVRSTADASRQNPWLYPGGDVFAFHVVEPSGNVRRVSEEHVTAGLGAWEALRAAASRVACSGALEAAASGATVLTAARAADGEELAAAEAALHPDARAVQQSAIFLHGCWQGVSSPSCLSASEYECTTGLCGDCLGPHAAVVGGGMGTILLRLAPCVVNKSGSSATDAVSVCLKLNACVTRIDWSKNSRVVVKYRCNEEEEEKEESITAKQVICALPASVSLQRSHSSSLFHPPLPAWKGTTSASSIAVAHYKKIVVKLSAAAREAVAAQLGIRTDASTPASPPFHAFFRPEHEPVAGVTRPFIRLIESWEALKGPSNAGIYAGILCGDDVWDDTAAIDKGSKQACSDEACVEALVSQLGLGTATPDAVLWARVTHWESDPLSAGAYYYCGPGCSDADVAGAAAPLLAGGDATSAATQPDADDKDEEDEEDEEEDGEEDHSEAAAAYVHRLQSRLASSAAPSSSSSSSLPHQSLVWFAGDAFHPQYLGSLHGALLSGRAAAAHVLAALHAPAFEAPAS